MPWQGLKEYSKCYLGSHAHVRASGWADGPAATRSRSDRRGATITMIGVVHLATELALPAHGCSGAAAYRC